MREKASHLIGKPNSSDKSGKLWRKNKFLSAANAVIATHLPNGVVHQEFELTWSMTTPFPIVLPHIPQWDAMFPVQTTTLSPDVKSIAKSSIVAHT
jgi:hypothetical protein